jgi:hypothetical protein
MVKVPAETSGLALALLPASPAGPASLPEGPTHVVTVHAPRLCMAQPTPPSKPLEPPSGKLAKSPCENPAETDVPEALREMETVPVPCCRVPDPLPELLPELLVEVLPELPPEPLPEDPPEPDPPEPPPEPELEVPPEPLLPLIPELAPDPLADVAPESASELPLEAFGAFASEPASPLGWLEELLHAISINPATKGTIVLMIHPWVGGTVNGGFRRRGRSARRRGCAFDWPSGFRRELTRPRRSRVALRSDGSSSRSGACEVACRASPFHARF